MTDIGYHTHPG